MSAVYRETISDVRLRAVVAHIRAWLLSGATGEPQEGAGGGDTRQTPRAG